RRGDDHVEIQISCGFQNGGDALAAANAPRRERVAFAFASQDLDGFAGDVGAGSAQRMPGRDGAAVDVRSFERDAKFTHARNRLACERFVQLHHIDVARRPYMKAALCFVMNSSMFIACVPVSSPIRPFVTSKMPFWRSVTTALQWPLKWPLSPRPSSGANSSTGSCSYFRFFPRTRPRTSPISR